MYFGNRLLLRSKAAALTDFGLSGCETGSAVEIWAPYDEE